MEQEKGAVYCRLSQDDGSAGESGSIQTQRTLLTQYCKEHSIQIVDYYCDDGWSGTNFERPEFKRMIDDIENGKINTVIVKDLSRFGREYAQMGLYIEHYFEEKGIRFIAVAEGIDSKKGLDNLMLPMTNVINSLYARQASTKTKAAHRARAGSGMFIGSRAPFGYQKDPVDRHHLIVDPEAAEVVKSIFQMFADGIGYVRMTKILRGKQILNPQAYFNQNNPDYYKNSDYWRKPFDWHATSVRAILNNPVYLGKIVFGRTKTKGFFDKHRIAADESEWVVSENTHEPLITQDLWDTVHQMMQARRRENSTGEVQPFAGLVKCADCGSSLNVSYDKRKGRYTGFSCWVYKNYGKERCTSHAIGWKTLNQLVLEDIRRNALDAHRHVADYMDMLLAIKEERQKEDIDRSRRELKTIDKRMDELTKILMSANIGAQQEMLEKAEQASASLFALWDNDANPLCIEVLKNINASGLYELTERTNDILDENYVGDDPKVIALKKALSVPFDEMERYATYVSDSSRFATHQGVKGLEFPRVMVILDDTESRGFLFSYEKLFGAKKQTATDLKNEKEGKDTSNRRTARLFYVACTRAMESLAVVAYSDNPELVKNTALNNGWFSEDEIQIIETQSVL